MIPSKMWKLIYSLHASLNVNSQRGYSSSFSELTLIELTLTTMKWWNVELYSTRSKVIHDVEASVGHDRVARLKLVQKSTLTCELLVGNVPRIKLGHKGHSATWRDTDQP